MHLLPLVILLHELAVELLSASTLSLRKPRWAHLMRLIELRNKLVEVLHLVGIGAVWPTDDAFELILNKLVTEVI